MKLHLNALGFSNIKALRIAEGCIAGGLFLAALGLTAQIFTQEWNIATTPGNLDLLSKIYHSAHPELVKK